jgi:phage replication-related protein YjqB (UPF0714/DUF867 family)
MPAYQSFAELVLSAVKGEDYDVVVIKRDATTTIAAIHGGQIEPPTGELARAIAAEDCNLYELRGLRADGAERLRIAVARYDEMRLRALMERSLEALALLGADGDLPMVHLGGRNQALKRALSDELAQAGFAVSGPASAGAAHDPTRFYNLPANGGVQMELSRGLRQELLAGPQSPRYAALVGAVRAALARYHAEVRDDVGRALERFERSTRAMPPSIRKPDCCDQH